MAKFTKKPVTVEAITFQELVDHGRRVAPESINGGMPWSFTYVGHHISHENDTCYLIPTLEGTMKMGPGDMLITGVKGEIYPCKRDIFEATYDAEPSPAASTHPPHQQRVLDEKRELDERLSKLDAFILDNPLFTKLPPDEQERLAQQSKAMAVYSGILDERIACF
ncbi:hypothetical protein ACFOW3_13325 [Acidovorax facilis]|uniref:Uncharacterized protein n=1 Tax=Acidovorax facilis TaxID=12917 RepID=A0ABV8DAK7_9BURK|nr:hypothetical protein [Acidovorax facilis]MCO4240827.1 hypothetical protein [Acidovorax facilis]